MDSQSLPWKGNMPIELVEDILLRLPVKAIGRFMLTCKRWYTLVKSAQFITRHLNQSKKKDLRVLIVQEGCYSIFFESHTTLIKQESGKIPFPVMERDLYIMGSCRGLVLVKLRVEHGWIVLLWNPSLEKFKLIDTILYDGPYDKWPKFEWPVFALGFHEATNDYRVVRMSGISQECNPEEEVVDVFSFTKDSWHRVDGFVTKGSLFPTITFPEMMADYANGAVHWLAAFVQQINDFEVNERSVALSFDFDNEVFNVIEFPDVYDRFNYGLELQELNGKLALLGHIPDDGPFKPYFTWVMMNYPLVESWSNIGCLFKLKHGGKYNVWPLVCTKKENCVFRLERGVLGYYNAKEDNIYELEAATPYFCPVIVDFVESLVLLDVKNEALEDQITSFYDLKSCMKN